MIRRQEGIEKMRTEHKRPSWMGDILLLITAIVWGGGFIGVVEALDTLTPFYMIAARFAIASLLMGICFFNKLKTIDQGVILPGIASGIFLFIGFAFQTIGATYIGVGKLAFLTALNVIIVPFIAWGCFKEKIKNYHLISSLIAVVGFGFLNLSNEVGFSIGIGELLGIGCALGFAGQIALLGHFARKTDPIQLAILQMITCMILGFICAVIFEAPPQTMTLGGLGAVAYLGLLSTFVAFLFQTIGQKYTSASRAAILLSMESVFGILLSVLLLKERLTPSMIIGASLIFAAVVFAETMHARHTARGESTQNSTYDKNYTVE